MLRFHYADAASHFRPLAAERRHADAAIIIFDAIRFSLLPLMIID
jgi:hypothetical protein